MTLHATPGAPVRLRRRPEPAPRLSVTGILLGVGLAMDVTLILEVN